MNRPLQAQSGAIPDGAAMTPLKRAFLALEAAQARVAALEAAAREPIAIIGLGCRVPGGGDDAASFWKLLHDGVDATGPVPADRWDVDALYHPDPKTPGRIAARRGGFLSRVDTFEPAFFGITRREAQGMDPQQRLLLEVCWEALEHAGQPPDRLKGTATGVYVGLTGSDYAYLQLESGDRSLLDAHFASGIASSIASGRLSYLLGLQGPSLTIDTACSSSLIATHLACQALRAGDCRMALAGGVNLILSPDIYVALSHARMLAPDGRCKTFDAAADGFARGEGCGVVVLKRLSDAKADGDNILAVILGSAVNQDGPSSGLTAPNGPAQEAVIREALDRAGVAPRDVSYIEAHGTGTQLGDPLEVNALGAVFGGNRDSSRPMWLGSVKTNVGHLEAAAGVTGLIKLVLSLRHRQIPAHLHFKTPSPHIGWSDLPVRVPVQLMSWEPIGGRRIAGVSSFGFSGTNAHIVLEEAPASDPAWRTMAVQMLAQPSHLFVLSARDARSLAVLALRYAEAFATSSEDDLAGICFSAAASRAHHQQRATVLVSSVSQLRERLIALGEGRIEDGVRVARVAKRDPPSLAFLFPGQGAQYAGMARQLDETQPVFRAAFDRCATVLDPVLQQPLRSVVFSASGDAAVLEQTAFTQPALFAVEYALAELWRSWGVTPDVVIGHSVGEYAAGCVAGLLSPEDAARLIAERGRLIQSLPAGGAMAAIFASEATVVPEVAAYPGMLAIAAVNGPAQTVISGAATSVDAVCATFTARGVRCQRLSVSHAFHSPLLEPMLDAFENAARHVKWLPPTLRLISNVTGRLADARDIMQPSYWRRHVREAVRFTDSMATLAGLAPDICLEVGPQATLLAFAEACFEREAAKPALAASLRKGRNDGGQLNDALSLLYLNGAQIDWRAVWAAAKPRPVELPTYPFQRERFWFPARTLSPTTAGRGTGHPLLGVKLRSALRDVAQFEVALNVESVPFLHDHQVQGRAILPATALLEMALAASRALWGNIRLIHDVVIAEPMVVADGEARIVQLIVTGTSTDSAAFEIFSVAADGATGEWQRHADGHFGLLRAPSGLESPQDADTRCFESVSATQHYQQLAARGLAFGPSLQGVREIRVGRGEAIGTVVLPDTSISGSGDYVMHPALLDACLQVMNAAIAAPEGHDATAARAYLPLAVESIAVLRTPSASVRSHARVAAPASGRPDTLVGEVTVFDQDGLVARISGIALRAALAPSAGADLLYEIAWERKTQEDAAWMPPPAVLAARVAPALGPLLDQADAYQAAFLELEALSTEWIRRAFVELGWRPQPGEPVTPDGLAARLGVTPRLRRLVARFLQILADDGLLVREGNAWHVKHDLEGPVPGRQVAASAAQPQVDARLSLARNCGPYLADVLRGAVDPLQLLFPGGSSELAERLYRDSPEAKAFNQLIRETVGAAVSALPATHRLRVLEVGGGTGGTTSWVAPSLPADRTRYLFTDIGQSMVARAREKFAAHAFMDFQSFDLERDPGEQGLGDEQFDLILASNVVHATSDLRQTLRRLRERLTRGGTLLMLEVAGLERWIDVTFGLTEGWWLFKDTELRRDYPLLSRDRWLALLQEAGFETAVMGAADPRSRLVLLAARNPVSGPAPRQTAARWLVLGDAGGVGDALATALRGDRHNVTLMRSRDYAAASPDAVRAVVASHCRDAHGVVHLWGLDLADHGDETTPSTRQRSALGSLLPVVQALGATSHATGRTPRLWIATAGAQSVSGIETLQAEQATLWGAGKAVALEHPELRPTRIDLDPDIDPAGKAAALLARLTAADNQPEMALRQDTVMVPRLTRFGVPPASGLVDGVRLEKASTGVFDDMTFLPLVRRPPAAGQVEIRVLASGVNFRDVMNAVAMRDDPEPLGGECAGYVVATGEGVRGLAVGDHVVAVAEASIATYATADQRNVAPIPAGLTFAEAATVPFAFMTAHHALTELGRLRAGETVLIHAAAGGVGTAAIQLAQRAGAIIIATAGSEAKRAFLRSLGVTHVLNSRTLDFVDVVAKITGGKGVDVVLNSLSGDFIAASVAALAPEGRFLEIGKRDIWSSERFRAARPHGRYHAIDLAAQRSADPDASFALFEGVTSMLERGAIKPSPVQAFPLEQAATAFGFMAQARHIGKIVLVQHDAERASFDRLDAHATYLVTGGLSGLGLLTASHLVERGARHLVLMGRRAPSAATQADIAAMAAKGAQIVVEQGDVSRRAEVERVIATIMQGTHPLRGVVHAAGALADGALMQQQWGRFAVPLAAKIDGTWVLHELTRKLRLDFFVMYSSIASVFGSPGQVNHAAANAFMDVLAAERRAQGLPALSIGWGAWGQVGTAADRELDQRLAGQGIDAIAPGRGLETLDVLTRSQAVHACVLPVRWQQFLSQPGFAPSAFFDRIRTERREPSHPATRPTAPTVSPTLLAELADATPSRRLQLLLDFVSEHVARVIGAADARAVDPRQPLNELGLDSLMAVELRNRLGRALALARSLPATLVFDFPTPELLAQYLDREVVPSTRTPEAGSAGGRAASRAPEREAIDEMSDEDIDRLYTEKMGRS